MKQAILVTVLSSVALCGVLAEEVVQNGARGRVYEVDVEAKEFTLLTATEYDPQQMGKKNRFRVRYTDKTMFTLVKTQRSLKGIPAEGRDAVAYLSKEAGANAEKIERFSSRTVAVLPTVGKQKQHIDPQRRRAFGLIKPGADAKGLTATFIVGRRKLSCRLARRGTVRFVSPTDASALIPFLSTARVLGRQGTGGLEVLRIEVSHLPDPREIDDPNLPRVLVIGDSISMNYNASASQFLEGKANYYRIEGNAGPTSRGVTNVDLWLGPYQKKGLHWDVIQLNHGLHDLAKKADGSYLSDEGQYKKNLAYIISRLKPTGAKLIWATTTPVPNDGGRGRKKGAAKRYNGYAAEVLAAHPDIRVTDLYTVAMSDGISDEWRKGNNVHFKGDDASALGKAVAEGILAALTSSR